MGTSSTVARHISFYLTRWTWLDRGASDLRLAARSLRRAPGFASATVASLVLGLSLAAATVAVTNAYLVRSLPYPESQRLYHVMYAPPGPFEPGGLSAIDWASVSDVIEHPVTASGETLYLADASYAQPVRGLRAGRGFLEALGVRAALGRSLTDDELAPGSSDAAMIGHSLWLDRFGGDSSVLGRLVRAEVGEQGGDARTFRIVGVLPPGFWFGRESSAVVDLLLPLRSPTRTYMVRLREGVSVSLAEHRITDVTRRVGTRIPADWTGVHLESAHERYVGAIRPVLVAVTAASTLVLLIACINVAVLVLLRALHRQKEMSIRIALGAGRRHIVRLLIAESALLCAVSVAIASSITAFALATLAPAIETQLGRPAPRGVSSIGIDAPMVVGIAVVTVAIALCLCLVPLATPWRSRLAETLRSAGRTSSDGSSMRRLRDVLVGAELAGTMVLLVGCGMMVRSVLQMTRADLGFQADHVIRTRTVIPARTYPDAPSRYAFYARVTEHAASLSRGRVALTTWPPFAESSTDPIIGDAGNGVRSTASSIAVGPDYFGVLGVPVREGRAFSLGDRVGSEPVAIVSESLARRLWPNGSAIGRRLRAVEAPGQSEPTETWRTVVGVVRDVRQTYVDTEVADVYIPFYQVPPDRYGTFYVATGMPAAAFETVLRSALAESDPSALLRDVVSVASENRQYTGTRFLMAMLSAFAAFASVLAVVGMYGVIAYAVLQRRREFAIRIALGATSRAVTRLSMRGGSIVLAIGLVAGGMASGAATRVLQNRLYGVPSFDVLTLLATSALLGGAGLLAVWWPARRAAVVDPMSVLGDD